LIRAENTGAGSRSNSLASVTVPPVWFKGLFPQGRLQRPHWPGQDEYWWCRIAWPSFKSKAAIFHVELAVPARNLANAL